MPVLLYDCETWYLTLSEERRLRLIESRILRRIFGPKRDENEEWRRLYNEELHSLYRSPNIVRVFDARRLSWARHLARLEENRSAINILTDKPSEARLQGRPRRRPESNIIIYLKELGVNRRK